MTYHDPYGNVKVAKIESESLPIVTLPVALSVCKNQGTYKGSSMP